MPLLSFMWADHICNDVQWLRADTFSWQSGAVYQAAYQHLVDDYNDVPTISLRVVRFSGVIFYRESDLDSAGSTYQYAFVSAGSATPQAIYCNTDSPNSQTAFYSDPNGTTLFGYPSSYGSEGIKTHKIETINGYMVTSYIAADGHKIVLANQESNVDAIYNATGVAWYYILDTVNQRFKLPRTKFGFTGLRDTVGNYVGAGLPNITATWTSDNRNGDSYHESATGAVTQSTKANWTLAGGSGSSASYKNTLDASRSSSIYGNSDTVQPKATQMYLYFYVGNFTQTALENTAGVTTEALNTKVTIGHEVVEFQEPTAANNYTWYRKYRDGWVEQGGQFVKTGGQYALNEQTLSVPMANTAYYANVIFGGGTGDSTVDFGITRTTTTLKIYPCWSSTGQSCPWFVCGMAA